MSRSPHARAVLIAIAVAALALSAGIVLCQPSLAMTEDLGRHLLLGRIIWDAGSVPSTNLLTYTHPDFPFVNHHWLSEVLMHLTTRAFGLRGLMLLKVVLLGSAIAIATWSAAKTSGVLPAVGTTTVLLPLMLERNSERPEMFAYPLFAALFFVLFVAVTISAVRRFLVVTLAMLLWVNLHLSFVYGLLLIGIYAFKESLPALRSLFGASLADERRNSKAMHALLLLGGSLVVTLVNPNGFEGATYPLTIFRNFGYETVENVGVLRLLRVLPNDLCIPYFLVSAAACVTLIAFAIARGSRVEWSYALALGFTALVFAKIRNLPYFVLVAIPACATAAAAAFAQHRPMQAPHRMRTALAVPIIGLNMALTGFLMYRLPPALSAPEPWEAGLDFFQVLSPSGNIFNNFDIGSYLEYRLYPKYKAFVDNRPEAFPAEFFSTYRRMQTDDAFRGRQFQHYGINSIVFSRTDITDWGIRFLQDIRQDPAWKLAYMDSALVIYERRPQASGP